jgi:hypothetical protein
MFPLFVLIGPLLKFLNTQHCAFSMVAPDLSPRRYWWPLLTGQCSAAFLLGKQGDYGVVLFPAKTLRTFEPRPLPWDLWVFHFAPALC